MSEIVELIKHRVRRLVGRHMTDEEAARLRGFIRWKIENKRAMDARDEVIRLARREARRQRARKKEG